MVFGLVVVVFVEVLFVEVLFVELLPGGPPEPRASGAAGPARMMAAIAAAARAETGRRYMDKFMFIMPFVSSGE